MSCAIGENVNKPIIDEKKRRLTIFRSVLEEVSLTDQMFISGHNYITKVHEPDEVLSQQVQSFQKELILQVLLFRLATDWFP